MYSFKDYILRTLLRHNAGSLQDIAKISLQRAVLLARGRSLGRDRDDIHLRPLHLDTGEGHPCTFDADQPLYGIKPRAGIDQPLHDPKWRPGMASVGHRRIIKSFMANPAILCSSVSCFS